MTTHFESVLDFFLRTLPFEFVKQSRSCVIDFLLTGFHEKSNTEKQSNKIHFCTLRYPISSSIFFATLPTLSARVFGLVLCAVRPGFWCLHSVCS